MKRRFVYVTIGRIQDDMNREIWDYNLANGVPEDEIPQLNRIAIYRLEGILPFPPGTRSKGGWRRWSEEELETIKHLIRAHYRLPEPSRD